MRYLTVLLFISFSFLSNAQTIIIAGKITNPKNPKFFVSSDEDRASKAVDLNKDGSFYLKINEAKEGYYTYTHNESQSLYLVPGDSVYITLNSDNFDETASYSGTGAEKCNFLKKKYMIYEYTKCDAPSTYEETAKLEPDQVAERLLGVQTILLSLLDVFKAENTNIPESFIQSELNKIKIQTAYYLLQLKYVYEKDNPGMLELYTEIFKQKYIHPYIVLDTALFKDDKYKDVILAYIDDLSEKAYETDSLYYKNESYDYPAAAIQAIINQKNFSDDFKDYCLYYFVRNNYVDGYFIMDPIMCFTGYYTLKDHQELYNDFKKYCRNENLKNKVEKSMEKYAPYFEYLERDDSTALANREVLRWLIYGGYIHACANRLDDSYYINIDGSGKRSKITETIFKAINNNIKSEILKNYLFQHYTKGHIKYCQSDYDESIIELFNSNCTSKQYKKEINELVKDVKKLKEGDKALDFAAMDTEGKEYTLKDLRGKYLYIDVWATWCGPCKKEIPYLEKLQEEYKDKNIMFISISVDKNMEAWKKMVKEGNMKGLQLFVENAFDSDLCEKYLVTAIPRFLLIDPEGKIVSVSAERPSGNIREIFEKLGL